MKDIIITIKNGTQTHTHEVQGTHWAKDDSGVLRVYNADTPSGEEDETVAEVSSGIDYAISKDQ